MKKYLITGCDGFIGSHLYNKLENAYGWKRQKYSEDSGKIDTVDMQNKKEIMKGLEKIRPDIIVHCAGCADVHQSVINPDMDFIGNVLLIHNLLFALHELQLYDIRVLYLSSAAVYGNPDKLPVREDAVPGPLSPYALHKRVGEEICEYFIQNYNADIKILRIFSAYGNGLRKQIFWDLYRKYRTLGKLRLFGTGKESRDYIHIDDLAEAVRLIALSGGRDTVYNVANGKEVSIQRAAEVFAECMEIPRAQIEFDGAARSEDPQNWKADISLLQSIGYKQQVPFHEGVRDYCEWLGTLGIRGGTDECSKPDKTH